MQLCCSKQSYQLLSPSAQWSSDCSSVHKLEADFFNLNLFCTVLNKTDVVCCSRKMPDEFLRDLLFKLLKYCKNFLGTVSHTKLESNNSKKGKAAGNYNQNFTIDTRADKSERLINMSTAQLMYQSAEFKSILNESQELQHLNLHFLKTDNQRLSFFINLYNLLCIHSHFYLASTRSVRAETNAAGGVKQPTNVSGLEFSFNLFRNRTEKLLFQQRMCYKVGQMGAISLYELKHLILMPRFATNTFGPNASWNKSVSEKFNADNNGPVEIKPVASTLSAETTKKRKSQLS